MRRAGFFTAEFYRHLTGVEPLPSDRRLGAGGHDQQHRFRVAGGHQRARRPGCRRGVPVRPDSHHAAHQGHPARALHAVGPADVRRGPGLSRPHRGGAGVRAHPRGGAGAAGRDAGATLHPDRRAVAGHPPGGVARVRDTVQRLRGGGAGPRPAGGAPVLRQLPGSAAGRAAVPAGAGPGARVPRWTSWSWSGPTARWRSWTSRPMSRRPAGTWARAWSMSRATTSSRPTRSPTRIERDPRGGRARGAAAAGARLRLQPDGALGDTAQAPGTRGGSRPGPRARSLKLVEGDAGRHRGSQSSRRPM